MKHKRVAIAIAVLLFCAVSYPAQVKRLKFDTILMGQVIDQAATDAGFSTHGFDDCHLAITNYKASNGETAQVRSAYFGTSEEAVRYFEWRLQRAEKVIERADEKDTSGRRIGRRAVSVESREWEVMRTNESTVRILSSGRQDVALELERQYGSRR